MALHGGDRHDPMMCVLKVSASFFGLHVAGGLHQHACDDLEAVGDPVLDFLEKYRLLPNEVIFLPSFGSGECHVGHREKEPNVVVITVVELAGVYDQVPRLPSLSDEINFVGGYFGAPRGSRLQQ